MNFPGVIWELLCPKYHLYLFMAVLTMFNSKPYPVLLSPKIMVTNPLKYGQT